MYFRRAFLRLEGESAKNRNSIKRRCLLFTIPVISLNKHDLLSDVLGLFGSTEPNHIADSWICLLVRVSHTHTSTNTDVEAFKVSILVGDGDETDIVGEHINVVVRRNSYRDFELLEYV